MPDADLTLAVDIGTGSVRAALVDGRGAIRAIKAIEHEQIVEKFGWAEQRPADWWDGVTRAIRAVLDLEPEARSRIAAVVVCGQMHATVLVDDNGNLTRDSAPLWNDKRTIDLVRAFEAGHSPQSYLSDSGNPPTPAWPGFKLAWLRDHDPVAYRKAAHVLMPKDYVNYRLTGEIAMDEGDASCSFLMNPTTRQWSTRMVSLLGLDAAKLPPIRKPMDILGAVTKSAAVATGLANGTPVLVGGADYPVALLGSGAARPGLVSDVTGTSCILTLIARAPLLDPEISNVATIEGNWGPFVLLETGGDGMRWARRAFHENALSYDEISKKAAEARAGANVLFFVPYLNGERLGDHRNARAQFFGLGAGHGLADLHRAVMEGVAFAAARHLHVMEEAAGLKIEQVIASSGGAKSALWLKIKASVYGVPIIVPEEPECGVVGCAIMASMATGRFSRIEDAVTAHIRTSDEIMPDPEWRETYQAMQPVFNRIYFNSQAIYDDLDGLARYSSQKDANQHVS